MRARSRCCLRRPHPCNRAYYSETVNDLDGLLCNAWRSIQANPQAVADAASWPVCEADLHARHQALLRWREERQLEHLMGDPHWHDPQMAGWWMWGQSCWIGAGWCSGRGPWVADETGRLVKRGREGGGKRQRPHLGNDGQGVNRPQLREPGVGAWAQLPHLGDNGKGVNRPQLREPGVHRKRPHLGDNGQGVNHAGAREPGVARQLPHLGDNGRGVNHAGAREPGVGAWAQRPHISTNGQGVNRPQLREPGVAIEYEYHPMTMPELVRWMEFLSARLRHVRILNGDWTRAVTSGASKTLPVRQGAGPAGIFLDPPYAGEVRHSEIYTEENHTVAADVRQWCLANGDDPSLRIVLAGFDSEHTELTEHGWREVEWYRAGFLRGGMGNTASGKSTTQQKRERLWLSPHCLDETTAKQGKLF